MINVSVLLLMDSTCLCGGLPALRALPGFAARRNLTTRFKRTVQMCCLLQHNIRRFLWRRGMERYLEGYLTDIGQEGLLSLKTACGILLFRLLSGRFGGVCFCFSMLFVLIHR